MGRKGFLQEVVLELCLGECWGQMEGVTLVNACSGERTWCVHGVVSHGAGRDAGKPQWHLHIWGLG